MPIITGGDLVGLHADVWVPTKCLVRFSLLSICKSGSLNAWEGPQIPPPNFVGTSCRPAKSHPACKSRVLMNSREDLGVWMVSEDSAWEVKPDVVFIPIAKPNANGEVEE